MGFRKPEKSGNVREYNLCQGTPGYGVCTLESQGKSYQNRPKSGKSGKVREFEKNVVPGQGKSGKIVLPKYLIRVVN